MASSPQRSWGTVVEDVLDLQDRVPAEDGDRVKRAICEAVEQLDAEHTWLHQGRFSFVLTAGKAEYLPGDGTQASPVETTGVPGDLYEIFGDRVVLAPDGDASRERPLSLVTVQEADVDGVTKLSPSVLLGDVWSGEAESLAWYQERFLVSPTPTSSGDVVRGRYRRSLGIPWASFEAGAWKFYRPGEPVGGAEMTDDYPEWGSGVTNGWFGALYLPMRALASHRFANMIGAAADAQGFLIEHLTHLERIMSISGAKVARRGIRPYFPGMAR